MSSDSTLQLEELVIKIQHGDQSLVPVLWQRTECFARRVVAPKAAMAEERTGFAADDLAQEAFFALIRAVAAYSAGGSFLTLFRWHLTNQLVSAAGLKTERERRDPLNCRPLSIDAPLTDDDNTSLLVELVTDAAAERAIEGVDDADYVAALRDALDSTLDAHLTQRQAEAVRLRYFGEMTAEQIGSVMGCSTSNASMLVRSGLQRLRAPEVSKALAEFVNG